MDYIRWRVRGIGSNGGWASLVTGQAVGGGPDLSGFVSNRADAYALADIFGQLDVSESGPDYRETPFRDRCNIDFRDFEPHWLQVKVIVEPEYKPVLERLYSAVLNRDYLLCANDLKWALNPEEWPGLEPRGALLNRLYQEQTV